VNNVLHYEELDSTNAEAKRLIRGEHNRDGSFCVNDLYGTVITAKSQTAGRGRLGRSFASPGGGSIYASFILEPPENPAEQRITAFAAVAVCLAVEKTTSYKPGIKWINDILVDGKKICGILAESVPGAVILGIGININLAGSDLPDGAGSLVMDEKERPRFFETLIEEVFHCINVSDSPELMDEYRERSVLLGKAIILLRKDEYPGNYIGVPAFCEGIADDGALIVRYEDGSIEELRSGEISVRLA